MSVAGLPALQRASNAHLGRRRAFRFFQLVYSVTESGLGALRACDRCSHCELASVGEKVIFLPYEAEYIATVLTSQGRQDDIPSLRGISRDKLCPFFRQNRCALHPVRPIDCRSFPVVPKFTNDSVELHLGVNCPCCSLVNTEFKHLWASVWNVALPYLPSEWRSDYNATTMSFYGTQIPPSELEPPTPLRIPV